jgi:hypothetical protein
MRVTFATQALCQHMQLAYAPFAFSPRALVEPHSTIFHLLTAYGVAAALQLPVLQIHTTGGSAHMRTQVNCCSSCSGFTVVGTPAKQTYSMPALHWYKRTAEQQQHPGSALLCDAPAEQELTWY